MGLVRCDDRSSGRSGGLYKIPQGLAHFTFFGTVSEYWNTIVSTVVGGVTYTVDYFRQIGSAVAGALGSILIAIFHPILDVVGLLFYFFSVLVNIFVNLSALPAFFYRFIVDYFSAVYTGSFTNPVTYEITQYLGAIPFWGTIASILGFAFLFLLLYQIKNMFIQT